MLRTVAFFLLIGFAAGAETLDVFGRVWTLPAASQWKVDQESGQSVLKLMQNGGLVPGPRRPSQFVLTDTSEYDRVTLEGDVMPLENALIIVYAYRDEAHFDYAHLSIDSATKQPVHNGIFHVYGGERVRISSDAGPAAFPRLKQWYRVKLTYDAVSGTVRVAVDGRELPALVAVDLSLGPGKIGLGSFFNTANFRNVRIAGSRTASVSRD